jgi:hypothetical protein
MHTPSARPHVVRHVDHHVITPPNHLRHAISIAPEHDADAAIARAEKALAALSAKFPMWMQAEWARLAFAHAEIVADGFNDEATARFMRVATDICANAPLFGYAAAADIAGSLCKLIEDTVDRDAMPRALVARHVDAIGAIARGATNVPSALELRLSATHHLLRESAMAIPAPSIAPD